MTPRPTYWRAATAWLSIAFVAAFWRVTYALILAVYAATGLGVAVAMVWILRGVS